MVVLKFFTVGNGEQFVINILGEKIPPQLSAANLVLHMQKIITLAVASRGGFRVRQTRQAT